jgi:DNA-directed RNA polymerase specialized sigma24 family protein
LVNPLAGPCNCGAGYLFLIYFNFLVTEAVQGSKDALEEIVRRIQQPVYSLSLRMLFNPEDAKDISQQYFASLSAKGLD